jgi:hypothetical protein
MSACYGATARVNTSGKMRVPRGAVRSGGGGGGGIQKKKQKNMGPKKKWGGTNLKAK